MNELADFHFDIRYRPGRANAAADTLSCMPLSFEDCMSSCSEMISQNGLDAVTGSIHEGNYTETAWLASPSLTPIMLEEDSSTSSTISPSELIIAQQEDSTISRVLHFMQLRKRLTQLQTLEETAVVRRLLGE